MTARWWDTAPQAASWTTQSGYNGLTVRVVLSAGLLAGSKLRFRFQAAAAAATSVSAAYVQLGGAGDAYDYSGDPIEIKFSGASGFSLSADEYIDSDEVTLPVTLADRIVVAFRVTSTNNQRRASAYVPGHRMFYKSGDDLATVDTSGYTEQTWPVNLVRVQAYDLEPLRTTVYEWTTSTRNDNWSNYNMRLLLPAGFFGTATKLRFRLLARTAGYTVDSMYVGNKAGAGDAYDFAAAPTQVLFGGSGSKALGVHEVAVSDDVTFSVTSATELIVAMHIATGGTSVPNSGVPASAAVRYKSGADESSTVDVSGYTNTTTSGVPIFRIEAWVSVFDEDAADSGALTDAAIGQRVSGDAVSDSGALTDAATGAVVAAEAVSDSVAGSDAAAATCVAGESVTDSADATDTATGVGTWLEAVADSAEATDSAIAALVYPEAVSDSAAATDDAVDELASQTYEDDVEDAADATDASTGLLVIPVAVTDAAEVTDAAAALLVGADAIADSAAATDAATGLLEAGETASDAAEATDSAAGILAASEAVSDAADASDAATGTGIWSEAVADALEAADSATDSIGAHVFNEAVEDALSASDAIVVSVAYAEAVADSAALDDSAASLMVMVESVVDSADATEALGSTAILGEVLADFAACTDLLLDGYSVGVLLMRHSVRPAVSLARTRARPAVGMDTEIGAAVRGRMGVRDG